MGEPERRVQRDGSGVGLVNVEHHLSKPAGAQVAKASECQRAAKTGAALGWIDAHHVDLADWLVPVARLTGRLIRAAVNFRPVEADEVAVPFGQEEPVGVEPWLTLAHVQVCPCPRALFRVPSKCTVI